MASEHERYLCEVVFKKPVIVYNYPCAIKAFYMRRNDPGTDGAPGPTCAAMDVLVPGVGELIGGSVREERHDVRLLFSAALVVFSMSLDSYHTAAPAARCPHSISALLSAFRFLSMRSRRQAWTLSLIGGTLNCASTALCHMLASD
jgi:aspartyl/asparaginyl-tRNA synthetase